MPETPYTETEMLLAVMNADEARAWELLKCMFPKERIILAQQADAMARFIREGIWSVPE